MGLMNLNKSRDRLNHSLNVSWDRMMNSSSSSIRKQYDSCCETRKSIVFENKSKYSIFMSKNEMFNKLQTPKFLSRDKINSFLFNLRRSSQGSKKSKRINNLFPSRIISNWNAVKYFGNKPQKGGERNNILSILKQKVKTRPKYLPFKKPNNLF